MIDGIGRRCCMNNFYLGIVGGKHPHGPVALVSVYHRPNDILSETNFDSINMFMQQHRIGSVIFF